MAPNALKNPTYGIGKGNTSPAATTSANTNWKALQLALEYLKLGMIREPDLSPAKKRITNQ